MREALVNMDGDPIGINPLQPADLLTDHLVQVASFDSRKSRSLDSVLDYQRNQKRYQFLKWARTRSPTLGCCLPRPASFVN